MQKTQTVCLVILSTIAVGFSLFYLRSVLLPFVISIFVVIGCRPVLEYLQTRLKLNRYVAFAFAFAAGTVLLIGFALIIWLSINDLARNSGAYETRLNNIAHWVGENFLKPKEPESDQPESDQPETDQPETDQPETGETDSGDTDSGETDAGETEPDSRLDIVGDIQDAAEETKKAVAAFFEWATTFLQSQLLRIAGSLSSLLSYGVLILIFFFFLLLGPESDQPKWPAIMSDIETQVRQYLVMKTVISALTGLTFGIVLWLFGVPLAVLFGFLAFLLNFIPNIGPLIATLFPLPLLVLGGHHPG